MIIIKKTVSTQIIINFLISSKIIKHWKYERAIGILWVK